MSISAEVISIVIVMMIATVIALLAIRREDPWTTKRLQRIPIPVDEGRRRRTNRLPPPEEEQDRVSPYALYFAFIVFVYLVVALLNIA